MKPPIQYSVFDNGFKLCVIPSLTSITTVSLVIEAGSMYDPSNFLGLAHFVEHLMLSNNDYVPWIMDAYTAKDTITIVSHTTQDYILSVMKHYRDIVSSFEFSQQRIAHEREIISREIMNNNSCLEQQLRDKLDETLFGSQIGHPVLGEISSLLILRDKDFMEFMNNHMQAGHMAMVVITPDNPARIKEMCQECFSTLCSSHSIAEKLLPLSNKMTHVSLDLNASSILNTIGIRLRKSTIKQRVLYQFIAFLLGGKSENCVLSQRLRESQKFLYKIGATYEEIGDYCKIAISYICGYDVQHQVYQEIMSILQTPPSIDYNKEWNKMVINNSIECDNRVYMTKAVGNTCLFYDTSEVALNNTAMPFSQSELSSIYYQEIVKHLS